MNNVCEEKLYKLVYITNAVLETIYLMGCHSISTYYNIIHSKYEYLTVRYTHIRANTHYTQTNIHTTHTAYLNTLCLAQLSFLPDNYR